MLKPQCPVWLNLEMRPLKRSLRLNEVISAGTLIQYDWCQRRGQGARHVSAQRKYLPAKERGLRKNHTYQNCDCRLPSYGMWEDSFLLCRPPSLWCFVVEVLTESAPCVWVSQPLLTFLSVVVITPILPLVVEARETEHREVKHLVQGHTPGKW